MKEATRQADSKETRKRIGVVGEDVGVCARVHASDWSPSMTSLVVIPIQILYSDMLV